MNSHQFTLEPYKGMKTRHVCPGCGKTGVFALYIDQATGEPLAATVGRCNREIQCGYHYKPKQYFEDNKHLLPEQTRPRWIPPPPEPPKPPTFIDIEILKASRKNYNKNNFVLWLQRLFDETTAAGLIARYHLGTSNHWPGAVVFWQIDKAGRVRTGKIMGYNATTGHRIKEPFNHITFVHSVMKLPDFTPKQCFFGEHLLKQEQGKPVAIVESEKTAIVASVYRPNFIWLAVGSLTNLNIEKCKPLSGRKISLFPDLGGFEKWSQKAAEIQKALPGIRFNISDLLEKAATETERQSGLDLCDYLIKFDWRTFTQGRQEPKPTKPTKPQPLKCEKSESLKTNYFSQPQESKPKERWPIDEIEQYFKAATLPTEPIKVNRWTTILDVSKFIEAQLAQSKAQNGNPYFKPGFDSLVELKGFLNQANTYKPINKQI
jgi:hypothetical protein